MQRGKVRVYFDEKGFGFIVPDDGSPDVFVHASILDHSGEYLEAGDAVEYETGVSKKTGRSQAVTLRKV